MAIVNKAAHILHLQHPTSHKDCLQLSMDKKIGNLHLRILNYPNQKIRGIAALRPQTVKLKKHLKRGGFRENSCFEAYHEPSLVT